MDVESHLLDLYRDKSDAMRKELLIVCDGNEQCVDQRLNQIQQYRLLHSYRHGAKTMMKIKEMFNLSGDFKPVEILLDLVSISVVLYVFRSTDSRQNWIVRYVRRKTEFVVSQQPHLHVLTKCNDMMVLFVELLWSIYVL